MQALIENGHLSDWIPEKDCMLFATDVSAICAEAIFRVKFSQLKIQKPLWAIWLVN